MESPCDNRKVVLGYDSTRPAGDADRPLRVAIFVGVFPRISNTFVINQITGLLDRGHDVHIFARTVGDFANTHVDVIRYRLWERMKYIPIPLSHGRRLTKALFQLAKPYTWKPETLAALDGRRFGHDARSLVQLYTTLSFLKHASNRYDIVHSQFGTGGRALLPLFRRGALCGRLITSFRGADTTKLLAKSPDMYKELFQRGDLFLPVSATFRRRLIEFGCDPELTVVHRSGIDCSRFYFRERTREKDSMTRVLFIGRLVEKKGLVYALRAVARAVSCGRQVNLTVVGDGPQRATVEAEIGRLGLGERVELLGERTQAEVLSLLYRSHLLVAPSVTASDQDQEGIPNVLKEAMASGMPVLSTTHSGIPELIVDGESGYLVPEREWSSLGDRLIRLIDEPESWSAMGRKGREKVEAEYDQNILSDRLVRLYHETLHRAPRYVN